jgi:hypothetical protein
MRLRDGGAEQRLTASQYGFRRGRGTTDAVFAARRHIDLALAPRSGAKAMLALDWKKAFDSINIQGLLTALQRFGVPPKIVRLVSNLYSERKFSVRDGGNHSTWREQCSGISQGCPLSPFLFIITMSIIIQDSIQILPEVFQKMIDADTLSVLLYADDTLSDWLDFCVRAGFTERYCKAGAALRHGIALLQVSAFTG